MMTIKEAFFIIDSVKLDQNKKYLLSYMVHHLEIKDYRYPMEK